LQRISYATEAHLHRVQEEKDHATKALKQENEEALEKLQVAQQEKDDIRAKFEEDREKIQKDKYQFLTEKIGIREAVTRELSSMPILA
jgi:hypothetical protein